MILLRKIVNLTLALILLVATTGVTLSKHYCMGRLKSVAINEHATQCYKNEADKMPCCEHTEEELKINEVTKTSYDFNLQPNLFSIAVISFVFSNQSFDVENENVLFREHAPPLPDQDILVLHQSFLI